MRIEKICVFENQDRLVHKWSRAFIHVIRVFRIISSDPANQLSVLRNPSTSLKMGACALCVSLLYTVALPSVPVSGSCRGFTIQAVSL